MAITNCTIKYGSTWTPSGGSDLTLRDDGRLVKDGRSFIIAEDTNLITRRVLQVRAIEPQIAPTLNGFDRLQRNYVTLRVPFVAASGKSYTQLVKFESSFHHEYTLISEHQKLIAAMLLDSDFSDFFAKAITV